MHTPFATIFVLAQAAPESGTDVAQVFLTAGVAGAVLLAAITGFIFFKPERSTLIETISNLRATNERYVELHHNTTLPTLNKALSQLDAVESTLKALTKAWEEDARSNGELVRRMELLERQIEALDRKLP